MRNKYEYLDEDYEHLPDKGKMSTSQPRMFNDNMASLKRIECAINRHRKETK